MEKRGLSLSCSDRTSVMTSGGCSRRAPLGLLDWVVSSRVSVVWRVPRALSTETGPFPDDGRYSRLSHRLFATGGGLCAAFV